MKNIGIRFKQQQTYFHSVTNAPSPRPVYYF